MPVPKVSFYSFKGGSGRSVTLANVAAVMGDQGKKVGIVEFDFEAPGLMRIFRERRAPHLFLQDQLISPRPDLIRESVVSGIDGKVFLIPGSYDWDKNKNVPPAKKALQNFSESILPAFEKEFQLDVVLLDSRSGQNNLAMLTFTIADTIVIVFRLDKQSVFGLSKMEPIFQIADEQNKTLYFVASNVFDAMKAKVKWAEAILDREIDVVLPRDNMLDLEEMILFPDNSGNPICEGYRKLSEILMPSK